MKTFTCENGSVLYRLILTKDEKEILTSILASYLADYVKLDSSYDVDGEYDETVLKLYNEINNTRRMKKKIAIALLAAFNPFKK